MGLIGNRTMLNQLPLTQIGGTFAADIREFKNWHCRENADPKCSIPNGYRIGGAWLLPQVAGALSLYYGGNGTSTSSLNLAGGLNGASSISGAGDIIYAQAGLIVSAVAAILASSDFNASIRGVLQASASLAGEGDITASLGALASAVAQITGNSPISCSFSAKGSISAAIKSFGDLSPESLAAAVWNSIAAQFNTAGSMGNKMNSASAAGDPWGAILPSTYISGEAEYILAQIQTLVDELHTLQGLNPTSPSTVTPTTWEAGSISIDITGDGQSSTTMTRQ